MDWVCPHCRQPLRRNTPTELYCPTAALTFRQVEGIWRFLLPERERYFAGFVADYEAIRAGEGRGSENPDYFRRLPFADLTGRLTTMWAQRAASFRHFLTATEPCLDSPRIIADIGAGNGWLTNQLTQRGHHVYPVDLLTNPSDGLGACHHYNLPAPAVQAEFDQLPFPDHSLDMIIFNAAFHYSVDYQETLRRTRNLLGTNGILIVLDTPFYQNANAGEQMVQERHRHFATAFGRASDTIPHQNFLTTARLRSLCAQGGWHLELHWQTASWRRQLRRLRAQVTQGRETAAFPLAILTPT